MSRPLFPKRPRRPGTRPATRQGALLIGALLLGAVGHAAAQAPPQTASPAPAAAPATPAELAALCAPEPELLDVTISGQFRGTLEVRRSDAATLVDAAALGPSEARYAVQTVSCDGTRLVQLSPELKVAYDPRALSLLVAARPQLLPGGSFDLAGAGPQGQLATPAFGIAYSALLNWSSPFGDGFSAGPNGSAVLDAFTAQGRLSGLAGVTVTRSNSNGEEASEYSLSPHALLAYDLTPNWQLGLAYRAAPLSAPGTLQGRDFRGVSLQGSNTGQRLDQLGLDLPLDARVTVSVDGVPLTTVDARAGELLLRNLPISAAGSSVVVEIEDATGRRTVRRLQDAVRADLAPGAYLFSAEAGWEDGQPQIAGSGSLGLRGDWTVAADGHWTGQTPTGGLSAAHTFEGGQVSLGVAARPTLAVTTGASRDFGRATLTGDLSVPLGDPQQVSLGVGAGYVLRDGLVFARASATPATSRWTAVAGGYLRREDRILGATLSAAPGQVQVGLTVTWAPRPAVQVAASAGVSGAQTQGRLGVLYRPAPGETLEAAIGLPDWRASVVAYTYERQLYARAAASPSNVSAAVSGALTVVGGRLVPGREVRARTLLIRTGVPGLPLRVNGAAGIVTDARGEALVGLETGVNRVNVRVLPDELPLNVSVQDDAASFGVRGNGLVLLDWRQNFAVSRWVRLFWAAGEPAAAADLHLTGGAVLPADPDGYVLLPQGAASTGTLQSQDGTRSCAIVLGTRDEASCAP